MTKKPTIITAAITAVCVFALTTAFYLSPTGSIVFGLISDTVTGSSYAKFIQFENIIEKKYMGSYNGSALMDNALHMYVASLNDPYSSYFNKNEYEDFSSNLGGDYRGIGVTVANANGRILIKNVQKNSPAQKGGIQKGDILAKVNGKDYSGNELSAAVMAIKAIPLGSSVVITVERGGKTLDLTVVIEEIKRELVSSRMEQPGIGYIRLQSFGTDVFEKFKSQIEELKKQGMKGLIIDLRSNPGGTLTAAVDVGNYLLPEGNIITIRNKSGGEEVYKSDKNELGLPMCVLINENSASASEVIAGALRDYKKATLVGKKTFGKGVVQTVFDLGDKTALRLTTAKYYTPSGECIHAKGIAPDIEVDLPDGVSFTQNDTEIENDTQLEAAITEINRLLSDGQA